MSGIGEPDELLDVGRTTRWRPPRRWVGLVLVLIVAALAATLIYVLTRPSHPSGGAAPGSPSVSRLPTAAASSQSIACTAGRAEAAVRGLVRDFNVGGNVVGDFLAAPVHFGVWWDPTLPPGRAFYGPDRRQLVKHLRALHHHGIRLDLTGFSGTPNHSKGIGFLFGVRRESTQGPRHRKMTAKGVLDCRTGRITTLVIDRW